MRITKKLIAAGAGAVVLVAGGGAAFAASTAAPKVTAERAIEIAHRQVPGAWVKEVGHDDRGARPDVWEVELVKGAVEHELDIDAGTGRLLRHQTHRVGADDHGGRGRERGDDHGGHHDD
ncbi:PepSY domain-containing protein [Nonomuraea sp. NPDC005983]|uniref:PepSY domain-containing protein n=1 Tax=Nonomuraea sp. NPDC005983 TaxID=3155595 RepID=UPI0033A4D353